MMKRRRSETSVKLKKRIAESNDQMKSFSSPIMDLPEAVFTDILLRLPLKGILVCKCVCKSWRSLILSAQFDKLHSAQSETSLLLRNLDGFCSPRICYLANFSDIQRSSFQWWHGGNRMNLNVRIKMPLRNAKGALCREAVKKNQCVRLRRADHSYKFVNACNGLICLSAPSTNDPAAVCNPFTGEYINIPKGHVSLEDNRVDCGFGFCPTTNQYKVIRLDYYLLSAKRSAEVHTLGTQTWRTIGFAPHYYEGALRSLTYLNGNLHWLYPKWITISFILAFDLEEERFRSFPPPGFYRSEFPDEDVSHTSMGVLRGNLCLCRTRTSSVTLFVMEEYGTPESWTRLVTFRKDFWGPNLFCQPIEYLRNGSLLMVCHPHIVLVHHNVETQRWHCSKVYGIGSKYQAITFIPSFLSLEEAVRGNERRVMNISSRCGKIKLQGERQHLYITEESIAILPVSA